MASGIRITIIDHNGGSTYSDHGDTLREALIKIGKHVPDFWAAVIGPEYTVGNAVHFETGAITIELKEGDVVDSETGVNGKGWPPTGQVRREDEGVVMGEGAKGLLEAIIVRRDALREAHRTGVDQPIGQRYRDSDQVHAMKYGIAAAARLISAPAGWPEGQPYDRWDQIIDEMEADGAWHHFTVTRAEVRRAMQKAVGEYRLAQLDGEEYGRDDLNPDPSGDFKDLAFITTPYSDLASAAYADTAEWLDHGGMEDH